MVDRAQSAVAQNGGKPVVAAAREGEKIILKRESA
jgi:hypothetical protein